MHLLGVLDVPIIVSHDFHQNKLGFEHCHMLTNAVASAITEWYKHVWVSSYLILVEPSLRVELEGVLVVERVVVVWDEAHIDDCTYLYLDIFNGVILDDLSSKYRITRPIHSSSLIDDSGHVIKFLEIISSDIGISGDYLVDFLH